MKEDSANVLYALMDVIMARRGDMPESSYTASLLRSGVRGAGAKVLEEAAEVVEAASELDADGRDHLIREAADLLYHLMVLMACRDISLGEVETELARRAGISGFEEKASRSQKKGDQA